MTKTTTRRLTQAEVHSACQAISQQGERPSSILLLKQLGRGSLSTITKHMNSWFVSDEAKAITASEQPKAVILPERVSEVGDSCIKTLWQTALQQAEQELSVERDALQAAADQHQQAITEAIVFTESQDESLSLLKQQLLDKDAELSQLKKERNSLDLNVSKLQSLLDHSVKEQADLKADLKEARLKEIEAVKIASELKGQITVLNRGLS